MKVELEDVRLGVSEIMGLVYVYVPEKGRPDLMKSQHDITEQFEVCARILGYTKEEET